jgi:hypothetical protein
VYVRRNEEQIKYGKRLLPCSPKNLKIKMCRIVISPVV